MRAAARGVLTAEHEGEGATFRRPVRLPDLGAMPADVGIAGANLVAPGEVAVAPEDGVRLPEGDAVPGEAEQLRFLRDLPPVEPVQFVVVAVGVVVAVLGAGDFVAHQDHRHALADEEHARWHSSSGGGAAR